MKDHTQYQDALALYAMNALDDERELVELREHLGSCGECRRELEAFRADTALLALSTAGPQPPQRSRVRLMEAVAAEPRHVVKPKSKLVLGRLQPRWRSWAPIAIALLLAIFSAVLARENLRLRNRSEKLAQDLQAERQKSALAQEIVAMMNDPSLPRMTLVSVTAAPQPQVKTIYQPQKGHILLMANNLPALPDDKVYQLWLLPAGGGSPMPAGTFTPDPKGGTMMMHAMDSGGIEAKAFAVTVEPRGGSQSPTMPMVLTSAG